MQIPKEDIRKAILREARKEFLERGYKEASMRSIARRAQVGVSNIYNYFTSKDELFTQVLSPVLTALDKMLEEHNNPDNLSLQIFHNSYYLNKSIQQILTLVLRFRKELKLLLFHANGSSLANYRNEFTDRQTETGLNYMKLMKARFPQLQVGMSPFFLHTISSWWLSIIGELVTHNNLKPDEIQQFVREFVSYSTAGWKQLMEA